MPRGSEDQIFVPIAIDIACRTHRHAKIVFHRRPADREAIAAVQGRQVESGRERTRAAEHDVSFADQVRQTCADDQVVQSIAVDVPGPTDAGARFAAGMHAV